MNCPQCQTKGRGVSARTLEHQVLSSESSTGEPEGWSLCLSPSCEVVYFKAEAVVDQSQVRAQPTHKSTSPERLVCFCFEHSVAQVQEDLRQHGVSTLREAIKAACKAGQDDCERNNPQGRCCLGNVGLVLKEADAASDEAQAEACAGDCCGPKEEAEACSGECCGHEAEAKAKDCCGHDAETKAGSKDCCGHEAEAKAGSKDCCGHETKAKSCSGKCGGHEAKAEQCSGDGRCGARESHAHGATKEPSRFARNGLMATGGALLAAVLSSACCWLPLLAIGLGASTAGVGVFFAAWRLPLLLLTAVLLGLGFGLAYRKPRCAPGQACATPNRKLQRLNRLMLWVMAVLVVVFMVFPELSAGWLGADAPVAEAKEGETRTDYTIEGLTCASCEAHAKEALEAVPGVVSASVSYAEGRAELIWEGEPDDEAVCNALSELGYEARAVE